MKKSRENPLGVFKNDIITQTLPHPQMSLQNREAILRSFASDSNQIFETTVSPEICRRVMALNQSFAGAESLESSVEGEAFQP